jgi:nucleoside-diphosphate-sugar epimerase
MRVLVIGGTGFIGRHVTRRLIQAGHEVTVFHRGQTNAGLPAVVNYISGERRELQSFSSEFKRITPDIVLDMICYNEQEATDLVASIGPACERVVVASSMDVYRSYGRLLRLEQGAPDPGPLNEDSPLRESEYPHRAIAKSPADFAKYYEKRHVERVVTTAPRMRATVLRLPAVYGPGDKYHRTHEYLKRMDDGREKILLEETRARWRWTRGYVENVADAIALAVTDERASGRFFNVGEPDALTEKEWVQSIGRAAGWNGEVVTLPKELMPGRLVAPYNFEHQLCCDTGRIREELGYSECVSRDEAMKKTVEWERALPPGQPPDQEDSERFNYAAEDAALAKLAQSQR